MLNMLFPMKTFYIAGAETSRDNGNNDFEWY